MRPRCRHRHSWIIAGGAYEWCYECGAFRTLRPIGRTSCVPDSVWCKPTGLGGENPFDAWHTRSEAYRSRPSR